MHESYGMDEQIKKACTNEEQNHGKINNYCSLSQEMTSSHKKVLMY
jgi:hypothetical protein